MSAHGVATSLLVFYCIRDVLALLVFVGSRVGCALVVTPTNTAVVSNDIQPVVLQCQSDLGTNAVSWKHRLNEGTSEVQLAVACQFRPGFSSIYSLRTALQGQCDLVINSTYSSLTGIYSCAEATGDTAQAHVTIIGQFKTKFSKIKKSCILSLFLLSLPKT